jgi:hypothetical protein
VALNGSIPTPPLTATTTFTLVATGPGGVTTAQTTVMVTSGSVYQICPLSAIVNVPFQFRAYHRAAGGPIDCSNLAGTTDVTGSVTWLSSNQNVATVVPSGASAGLVTKATTTGSTTITTTPYLGLPTTTAVAHVICVPSKSCASDSPPEASNTCANDTTASFTIDDGCGFSITCPGTRTCDYNWKEVGQ